MKAGKSVERYRGFTIRRETVNKAVRWVIYKSGKKEGPLSSQSSCDAAKAVVDMWEGKP